MENYNLTFICKTTEKEVKGRKIDSNEYSLIDPITNEKFKLKTTELRKKFKSSKENNSAASKTPYSRPRMFSARTCSKEFREYLKERAS